MFHGLKKSTIILIVGINDCLFKSKNAYNRNT